MITQATTARTVTGTQGKKKKRVVQIVVMNKADSADTNEGCAGPIVLFAPPPPPPPRFVIHISTFRF